LHISQKRGVIQNIFAAGIAVDVPPPFKPGKVAVNVPKTGYSSDEAGKVSKSPLRS